MKWLVAILFSLLFTTGNCQPLTDDTQITVLNYHGVTNKPSNGFAVSESNFITQIRYLSENGYQTISMGRYMDFITKGAKLPPKPILLTFDDGLPEHYEKVFPILRKYGFVGTLFIDTDAFESGTQLSTEQLNEMLAAGFSVGIHSKSHQSLIDGDMKFLKQEMLEAKQTMEKVIGRSIDYFAYPFGFFDEKVIEAAKKFGYTAAFTTIHGRNNRDKELLFEQRRITIMGWHDIPVYRKLLEADRAFHIHANLVMAKQALQRQYYRYAESELNELLKIDPEHALAKRLLQYVKRYQGTGRK